MAKIITVVVQCDTDNSAENAALREFCDRECLLIQNVERGSHSTDYHLYFEMVDVDTVRSVLDAMADEIGLE